MARPHRRRRAWRSRRGTPCLTRPGQRGPCCRSATSHRSSAVPPRRRRSGRRTTTAARCSLPGSAVPAMSLRGGTTSTPPASSPRSSTRSSCPTLARRARGACSSLVKSTHSLARRRGAKLGDPRRNWPTSWPRTCPSRSRSNKRSWMLSPWAIDCTSAFPRLAAEAGSRTGPPRRTTLNDGSMTAISAKGREDTLVATDQSVRSVEARRCIGLASRPPVGPSRAGHPGTDRLAASDDASARV